MRNLIPSTILLILFCFFISCNSKQHRQYDVREIMSPANVSSRLPYLTSQYEDGLYMSWVENLDSTTVVLKYASLKDETWTEPVNIASGDDWFVNWADFPSLAVSGTKLLMAHWLHKIPGNTYSYEVNISVVEPGTSDWSPPITPHQDGTATEHGFVSMIPWNQGQVLVVWLDGRETAERTEEEYGDITKAMTLRSAVIDGKGNVTNRRLIDNSVCDCCQTSLVQTRSGAIAAYRDRTDDEIRDIYVSRYAEDSWSEPVLVHRDGWKIGGCPVNGPMIAAHGDTVLVAWFTGADERYSVKASFSFDGGLSFEEPVAVDEGDPIGRVDAGFVDSERAVVSWMEKRDSSAELKVRILDSTNNRAEKALKITDMDPARSSGFPQLELINGDLVLAWTDIGEHTQVKMARVPVKSLTEH